MRAHTNMADTEREVGAAMSLIAQSLQAEDDTPLADALCIVATYIDVSMRVLKKTNPSKIRDEARTVEIQARMDGKEVEQRP